MTPEEFRIAGHDLIDWIADFRERVPELPVRAETVPGDVRRALATAPPETPGSLADLVADLDRVIVPGLTQIQSPSYFAWFPSNASLASVLGDLTSSGLGALGITWQSAPALTELEEVVTEWLRELTGLAPGWRGAIHDTASSACLVAMLAARERASKFSEMRGGLQGEPSPYVVYASPHAHSSIPKAVLLAGFGHDNLRYAGTDPGTFAMDPESLRTAMTTDVAAGRVPAAVVVSLGTTGTTAFDPTPAIVAVAREFGAWVHVDAAMAGSAMLLPECRHLFAGVDDADSIGWNPHKWLGTVLDTSLLYVRDVDHLVRVMATNPSYLQSSVDGSVVQYKDWGIPLGRRFRALKLWFHLRLDGAEAIRARLRRDLANAQWLAEVVRDEPEWELVAPVLLQTVCVRHVPAASSEGAVPDADALDSHTRSWVEALNATGLAFVTPALLEGRWMVRVSIGAEATERSDVERLWQLMRTTASVSV
jgi:aromatic-L-amino-acid decarboxylase